MRVGIHAFSIVLAAALCACQGRPVPLSAQAGSTILIPLNGLDPTVPIGYGGSDVTDYQRGTLEFSLDTPSGPYVLVTRATSNAMVDPATQIARGAITTAQVVSLVNIPAGAPNGTYGVDVFHNYTDPVSGLPESDEIQYYGEISILPNEIEVTLPDLSTEIVTGEPTPFAYLTCFPPPCDFEPTTDVWKSVPDPQIRIVLSPDVWAVELAVSYPDEVINVLDAFELPLNRAGHLANVWTEDDGMGQLVVHAAAQSAAFAFVSIVFQLDDGASAILDPADIDVTVVGAWDENGTSVSATPLITGIF